MALRYSWTEPTATEPFPDGPGDALDGAKPHVAGREHARHDSSRTAAVGGAAAMRPWGRSRPVRMNPRSFTATRPPSHCVRGSAPIMTNTAAAGTCSRWPVRTSSSVRPSRRAWPWPSATRVPSRTSMLGVAFSLGDEVVGHAGRQRLAAYEHRDPGGEFGQMQGGLTGRVGPTNNAHVLAGHGRGFDARRAVEHACPDEPVQGRDAEPAVGHTGRDDHRPGDRLAAITERHHDGRRRVGSARSPRS